MVAEEIGAHPTRLVIPTTVCLITSAADLLKRAMSGASTPPMMKPPATMVVPVARLSVSPGGAEESRSPNRYSKRTVVIE